MNQSQNTAVVHIGVDVSAKTLEIAGLKARRSLSNDARGHTILLRDLPAGAHVVLEATGGYERALWLALLRAGRRVSRLNPARVRHFAKAESLLAKTDKLDAELLAEFGRRMNPAPDTLPHEAVLQLDALVARREQLAQASATQQVQLEHLTHPALLRQGRSLMRVLRAQMRALERDIVRLLGHETLQAKACRLQQLQGVGPIVSATLLSTMPELGSLEPGRAAALAGLAPYNYDSGPMRGQRHIRGGRLRVRRVLYMAALSAITHNQRFKAFYQNLMIRGKSFKVAITATMRKLIVLLNRMLKEPNFRLAN